MRIDQRLRPESSPFLIVLTSLALADPKLIEDATREGVVIATPATMVALLQAVGLAWREVTLSERAERVRELAVGLCRRIATFGDHLAHSGKGLERAVKAHNEAVGSFEGRILPTTRRMAELGVAGAIEAPPRVETQLRAPADSGDSTVLPDAAPESQRVAIGHG